MHLRCRDKTLAIEKKLLLTYTCIIFINRHKRQALPAEPGSLADITLVGDWTTTGVAERKPFLIHDRGNDEPECMLVFDNLPWWMFGLWMGRSRLHHDYSSNYTLFGQPSVQALYPVSTALRSTHW